MKKKNLSSVITELNNCWIFKNLDYYYDVIDDVIIIKSFISRQRASYLNKCIPMNATWLCDSYGIRVFWHK